MKPLRRDSVPAGYKQTEVGVIPKDWDVKPLHSLADRIMVGIASAATHAYRDRGVVMFRNQNIKPGYLDDSDLLYITEDYERTFKNKRLKAGDLLTARTGYPGTTSIVPTQYEGAQSFTTLITRPRREVVDSGYLCVFINSEAGQTYFEQNQIGGGQKNVNAGSLKNLLIAFPPTKAEQGAIAEALSDADALIESLEQLLTKKRQLKQGAMQELLTGKNRLPGFSGEWEVKALCDVCVKIQDGTHFSPTIRGGKYFYITSKNIGFGTFDAKDAPRIDEDQHRAIYRRCDPKPGDLLLTKDGASTGNAALNTLDEEFSLLSSVALLRFDPEVHDAPYFLQQILSHAGQTHIKDQMSGNAITRLTLAKINRLRFPVCEILEQRAIASILSDMDAEIAALEAKLAKARQLKQGMMQELLTGRIRLIN